MRRSPQAAQQERTGGKMQQTAAQPVDLGLTLSVYGKRADGSLVEIGNPASPLSRQSAAGTWPTEQ